MAISAAPQVSASVTTSGEIEIWGYNSMGILGNCVPLYTSYVPIPGPQLQSPVVALSLGSDAIVALADGTAWKWGGFLFQPSPTLVQGVSPVVAVASKDGAHAYVRSDGSVWVDGTSYMGMLGVPPSPGGALIGIPQPVVGLSNILRVEFGALHTLAVRNDGTVWGLGDNGVGQLGVGSSLSPASWTASPVQVLGLSNVVDIAVGQSHNLALLANGQVMAWGFNGQGQLGNGTLVSSSTPILVPGLTNIVAVAAAPTRSVAVDAAGTVWAWGSGILGELGVAPAPGLLRTTPAPVPGLSGITAIDAAVSHTLALDGGGVVWAWGWSGAISNGVLGRGAGAVPEWVPRPTGAAAHVVPVGCPRPTITGLTIGLRPSYTGFSPSIGSTTFGVVMMASMILYGSAGPASQGLPIGSGAFLYLDPGSMGQLIASGVFPLTLGNWPFWSPPQPLSGPVPALPIPNDPSLAGLVVTLQAAVVDSVAPGAFPGVTNALELHIN